ncbi:MAG: lipid-A-disaccharide synthase [Cellvibrionales bacterium TMED148]|nr:lipid-A-disaccharide synthase [Porticoccaceae bacterium]RPG89642.1 MAG: lipid-A-disaccharide synthase [Cellvibrionales bacterium TMED148]
MSISPVFAIVAGEPSGDALGADLIDNLKKHFPEALFEGIGGSLMEEKGFHSLFNIERLSIMGLFEPLKRLPELLSIRQALLKRFLRNRPLVFIGIDSPDFNLNIERKLHRAGVKTVHYVSPSVWAWRRGRIKTIKKSVDLMLTLFPFETDFFQQNGIPVKYVGHPLAKQFEMVSNSQEARSLLKIDAKAPTLAVMPGSRLSEIRMMAQLFLDVVFQLSLEIPNLQIILPAANDTLHRELEKILSDHACKDVKLLNKHARLAMTAADAVLLTSGTTSLEAMLLKKPMVVCYKVGFFTYSMVAPFIHTPYIAIPNLLSNSMLVPELIQSKANVKKIGVEAKKMFDADLTRRLIPSYDRLHRQLNEESGALAADAIVDLLR